MRLVAVLYAVTCSIAFLYGTLSQTAVEGVSDAAVAAILVTAAGLITDWTFSTSGGMNRK